MRLSTFRSTARASVSHAALCWGLSAFALLEVGDDARAAGPTGPSVVAGQASVSAPSATSTVINQSSERAVINWKSFSISADSSVQFIQPNASAITLNRVTGTSPSDIEGSLFANGQVWLINGNGILFGRGSRIDVGALIATTSDISNGDFMSGNYDFNQPSTNRNAGVTNQGTINVARGGAAVFAGNYVSNDGLIRANLGQVVLAGASTFTVDFSGDSLLRFAVTAPVSATPSGSSRAPVSALVSNSGTILASGGQVTLTARAASSVVDNVVNNSGMIDASSASVQGGEVVLDAGTGDVSVSGTISVAGKQGGSIVVAGSNVALSNATLDASGAQGGGSIAVGNTSSASVTADPGTTLDASAVQNGNGGKISVVAQRTTFSGAASAKGGANGGNGGSIETSGDILSVNGARIDTSAPFGRTGTWTLDPEDVTISNLTTSGETLFSNAFTPSADSSIINAADLEAALALNNVVVNTGNVGTQAGDITVAAAVTWSSSNTLTLDAFHSININAAITITGAGGLDLINNDGGSNGEITAGTGGSVRYTDLIGGVPQGSFSANGIAYTLLGTLASVEAINSNLSGNFALADSLDASSIANWTPIGTSATPFTGRFVGLGNTISNLTINTPTATDVGMFGVIGTGGKIYYLNLSNADVTGGNNVGILAGENDGQIIGGSSSGNVTAVDFTDDGVNGTAVGGLVGMNTDLIDRSFSSATVTGLLQVGGLVGHDVNLVAGIRPVIENSFASGNVTGVDDANEIANGVSSELIGGLVGQAATSANGTATVDQTPLLLNDGASGNVTGDWVVGGLAGNLNSGEIDGSYATGSVTATVDPNDPNQALANSGIEVGGLVGFVGDQGAVGTVVSGSWATGAVSGDQFVGGLVGIEKAADLITNSYATGSVTGVGPNQLDIGGLVGKTTGVIADSYATGSVSGLTNVGGLVGLMGYVTTNPNNSNFNNMSSSVTDSWTSSSVSGSTNVGGFVGLIETGASGNSVPTPTITGGYFDSDTSGTANGVGGGDSSAATVTGLTTAQMMTASSFSFSSDFGTLGSGLTWVVVDSDGSLNNAGGAAGGTFPMLISEYSHGIVTAHQLQLMALDPSASYRLITDINALGTSGGDVWGAGGFIPVGGNAAAPFSGTFEGNGFTIDGLYINQLAGVPGETAVGLFGNVGSTGYIGDVGLTNVDVTGGDQTNVGAIAGGLSGTVDGVYSTGSVTAGAATVGGLVGAMTNGTVANSHSSATVSGGDSSGAGGLIGAAIFGGTVENSDATGIVSAGNASSAGGLIGVINEINTSDVTTVNNDFATGSVSAGTTSQSGGLIGVVLGSALVEQSYASGAISVGDGVDNDHRSWAGGLVGLMVPQNGTPSVTQSYATGTVTGGAFTGVGGLVGLSQTALIDQSYATGAVSAGNSSLAGGLVGVALYGGTVENSYATGSVSAGDATFPGGVIQGVAAGGLIGSVEEFSTGDVTTINNDYSTGSVSAGSSATSGGLIGFVRGPALIEQSNASGAVSVGDGTGNDLLSDASVAGGLVGNMIDQNGMPTVTQSFATGSVSGGMLSVDGGLVGVSQTGLIDQSYATGSVSGGDGSAVGGLVGAATDGGSVENSNATGSVSAGNATFINNVYEPSIAGGLIGSVDEFSTGDVTTVSDDFATGSVSTGTSSFSGGLIGYMRGPALVELSHATGSVSTADGVSSSFVSSAGGLVGTMVVSNGIPTVTQTYATGSVTGGAFADVGGLAGNNAGSIDQSYAIGAVTAGDTTAVGGLVGYNTGSISQDYAVGAVTGGVTDAGGLVGNNLGSIAESYAMGAVSAQGLLSIVGGLVGLNSSTGTLTQTFSTGYVTAPGGSNIGGLIGENDNSAGSITASYYDMQTSGVPVAIGAGTSSPGAIGETTAALQSGLPAGFTAADWGIVAGTSYPYLAWQFPSGTPQVVSGIVYSDSGVTPVGPGDIVNLDVNGTNPVTLTGSNLTVTGANGYYYFLLAPGTIPVSNGQVMTYTKGTGGGVSLADNADGSATGVPIWADTLWLRTPNTLASQVDADLHTVRDTSPDKTYLESMTNLYGISTAAAFTFDQIIHFAGTITILTNGPLTIAPNGGFTSGALGDAVTLVAPSFINNAGSGAITLTGGGRWLIYTNAPGADTFGGLNSNNTAVWNTTYPSGIVQAGDRYVFAFQPTLTITSADLTKNSGDDATSLVAGDYTVSGLQPGVANAFLGDTAALVYSGAPDVTSLGAAVDATLSGSPYPIVVGVGSLVVGDGYALSLVNGALTVNPPITSSPVSSIFVAQPPSLTDSPPPPPPDQTATTTDTTSPGDTTSPTAPSGSTSDTGNQESTTYVATADPIASMTDETGGTSDQSDTSPESDGAATTISQSLDAHPGSGHGAGIIISGLLRQELRSVKDGSSNGVPSPNQVFSSWGNEALWQ